MTKEKEQRIFEVYGITPGPWEIVNTGAEDGETNLIASSPSMLIKLWETVELLDNTKPSDMETVGSAIARNIYHSVLEPISDPIKQFLSLIHPEKLPFEEIKKRVNS